MVLITYGLNHAKSCDRKIIAFIEKCDKRIERQNRYLYLNH